MAVSAWRRQDLCDKFAMGTAVAGTVVAAASYLRHVQWREKRRVAQQQAAPPPEDLLRNGFSAKKLPAEIDHVIIGSGLSGLYLAALLARVGRRVVVLEQHYVAGGCTHTFKDKGFEFDTGVHYVGSASQFTAFMDFAAGRRGAFKMERQGRDDGSEVYNEIHAGGCCVHRFRPGPKTFIQDLVQKFPQERKAIHRFFRAVTASGLGMMLVFSKQFIPEAVWKLLLAIPGPVSWVAGRYIKRSLAQALEDCGVQNATLRAIVSTEFGDHGMVPEKAPFFLHAGILSHYMPEGGFSPVGGSDSFAQALLPTIFEAGGTVLVRAPVDKIVEENGHVLGVELAGGKGVIRAKCSVISSAGVEVTYRKLLDEVAVQKIGGPPQSLLASEAAGTSHHVYGFFGFDGTTHDLKLPTYNIWSLPPTPGHDDMDLTGIWNGLFTKSKGTLPRFLEEELGPDVQVPAFISFPSAKDSLYQERCPGKSTAVVLTESHAEYFGEAGPTGKRGNEYEVIKDRYKELLSRALFRHFPHLKGKASYCDVATPLSNEHYLGRAASYGLDQNAARFLDPTLRVTVPGTRGLYLTGQDFICGGVFPQVFSAWLTLSKVMGVTSPDFWLLLADFVGTVGWRLLFDRAHAPKNP